MEFIQAIIDPFQNISLPLLLALLVCVVWLLYLWRIDIFRRFSFSRYAAVLILGGTSSLLVFVLEVSPELFRYQASEQVWWTELWKSVVYTGLFEEMVKLLPVLVVVAVLGGIRHPFELLLYGSLSALGFATVENFVYLNHYGLEVLFARFAVSTMNQMAMTSLICYFWASAQFVYKTHIYLAILFGWLLAAVIHGIFNFFVSGSTQDFSSPGILISYFLAYGYYRMIRHSLSLSSFVVKGQRETRRLTNYGLFAPIVILLIAIPYMHATLNVSSQAANYYLVHILVVSFPTVIAVFGALGRITITPVEKITS